MTVTIRHRRTGRILAIPNSIGYAIESGGCGRPDMLSITVTDGTKRKFNARLWAVTGAAGRK